MTLLTKNSIIEVGLQADRNTPVAALTPVKVYDVEFQPFHAVKTIERMNATGVFGNDPSLHGGHLAAVTFSWELTPTASGGATVAPTQDALYKIAAFTGAVSGDNYVYSPISDPDLMAFAQINYYFGPGRLRTILAAVCSALSITFNASEKAFATATFVGFLQQDIDAPIGNKTFSAIKPYICKGVDISLGGVTSLPVKSVVLEMGLATPDRADMTNDSAYAPPIITNRIVTGTLTMEQSKNAINNWGADIRSAAEMALSVTFSNPDMVLACPHCVLTTSTDGDDDGVRTDELSFMAARESGNDEISLSFGQAA